MDTWFRKRLKVIGMIIAAGVATIFITYGILLATVYVQEPPPLTVPQTAKVYDAEGELIAERSTPGVTRYWISVEDMSQHIIDATLAAEDADFFTHNGFDYSRIAAATIANLKSFDKVQGASTLTQQYARNLFGDLTKTWSRKIREAYVTLQLEMHYSKEDILEGYLNTIYFGHGVYGVEAAAQYFFNTSASDLTIAEAALLAGIPKGPGLYSPEIHFDNAKDRQGYVLKQMVKSRKISKEDAEQAKAATIALANHPNEPLRAPYYQQAVFQALQEKAGLTERQIQTGGLRIFTTLQPHVQASAEQAVSRHVHGQSSIQAAVVVMEPKTGKVRALVGGRDFEESAFNRATQAKRAPGSTFKPLLYYTALANGFTPATTLVSEPTTFRYDDGREVYKPDNYNGYYANAPITMAQALALSDNIFAVKTNLFLGEQRLIETAKTLGIDSALQPVPSLALGTSPVSLMEMTEAYTAFANQGVKAEPLFIERVENYRGEVLYEAKPELTQALDRDLAFLTAHMMTGMFDQELNGYTTVTGQDLVSELHRPYAGKSGTTNTDTWMIGFTPQLVSTVWLGYDQGQTLDIPAEKVASKKIWADVMEKSHEGLPLRTFQATEGVIPVAIDPSSGKRATTSCKGRMMYFERGTAPQGYCQPTEPEKRAPTPVPKKPREAWWKEFWPF
ncbi:penicillin-binding protein [Bacillaceae bacterium SIJ1]|nr:transglycosylase domain-containing protein [Litoribacterium kuwaitense]NGP44702.1 penicillin-binding protein [Litoribacterium kuwaitense]